MTQSIPLTKGQFALVDDADFVWLNLWRWRLSSKGYAVRSFTVSGKELLISMHCDIMLPTRPLVVDHIDRDKLNNTRANLRLLTPQQNSCNRGVFKNNSTGFKGVTYQHDKWHARIETDGQTILYGAKTRFSLSCSRPRRDFVC